MDADDLAPHHLDQAEDARHDPSAGGLRGAERPVPGLFSEGAHVRERLRLGVAAQKYDVIQCQLDYRPHGPQGKTI